MLITVDFGTCKVLSSLVNSLHVPQFKQVHLIYTVANSQTVRAVCFECSGHCSYPTMQWSYPNTIYSYNKDLLAYFNQNVISFGIHGITRSLLSK